MDIRGSGTGRCQRTECGTLGDPIGKAQANSANGTREPPGDLQNACRLGKESGVEHGKVISSANLLDLRKATEESIRAYDRIGSVNLAIVSPETRHLLHMMNIGSINGTAEVAADVEFEVILGPLHIGSEYFSETTQPAGLLVMGPVNVDPEIRPEDLRRGLAALVVMGPIQVPAPVAGVLQERTKMVMGPVRTYPVFGTVHKGDLQIDQPFLDSLQPGTEMTVVGSVTTVDGLPAGAIRKKLSKLYVTGTVTCFEDQSTDMGFVLARGSDSFVTVPNGHKIVNKTVRLDRALLESISDRKLYFMKTVEIAPEVDAALFASRIDSIGCRGWLIAPTSLQGQVGKTCDLLNTLAFFYEGTLVRVNGESTLTPSRFDFVEGKLALFVTGVLQIDPSIRPDLLTQRVSKVLLSGVIQCSPEQQIALESRMESMTGVFDRYAEDWEASQEGFSANYLAL